ncbi:MAG: MarR family transcriptional regulator [Myxococcota bacterium]
MPQLNDLICFAVYTAEHAFNRVYKPLLRELGLTYPQYLVMIALWSEDDQTVGGLGKKLMLASSTLTPLLKRLEKQGHVARRRDTADERQVRVRLTEQGLALRERASSIPSCITEATGMSNERLAKLIAEITAVREHLLDTTK